MNSIYVFPLQNGPIGSLQKLTYSYYYLKTYTLGSSMKNLWVEDFRLKKLKIIPLLYAKNPKALGKT